MAILISEVLDNFLAERNVKKKYKAKSFWASSAGTCFRKRYFQRTNQEKSNPFPKTTLRKFYVGDTFHEIIQNLIKEKAKYFDIEKRVEDKNISGYVDLLARFNGETTLYEVKSVSDFYFKYLEKMKWGANFFHICQALTYYWLLKDKPDSMRIVYVGTSTLKIKEIIVPITKKSLKWIKDDWTKCITYYKDKKLPPKTEDTNQCKYCTYAKYCNSLKGVNKL